MKLNPSEFIDAERFRRNPPDCLEFQAYGIPYRYIPAPPEGAPSWKELAAAIVGWEDSYSARISPADHKKALDRLSALAERLRPLVERAEGEAGPDRIEDRIRPTPPNFTESPDSLDGDSRPEI